MTTNNLASSQDQFKLLTHADDRNIARVSSMHEGGAESQIVVSVVVPTRNEARYIHACLQSLVNQTFPCERYEILVADGRSSDNSRDIVALFETTNVRVRLLDNAAQTTPSGMNLGIRSAIGEVIVIAGAHTLYPVDFVENCFRWLDKTGADVVGGPVTTIVSGENFGAKLAGMVLSSPFGVGNSHFRISSEEAYVDTVPFGAYRRTILERVGLFNERLIRNQDNDLSARIRNAGGKIFLTPALMTTYIPAHSFSDLLRQTFQKSQWHIFTLRENMRALGWRHFCPAIFVTITSSLSIAAALESSIARLLLALLLLAYFSLGFFASFGRPSKHSRFLTIAMPFACFAFHWAYGLGTLAGFRNVFVRAPLVPFSHVTGQVQGRYDDYSARKAD